MEEASTENKTSLPIKPKNKGGRPKKVVKEQLLKHEDIKEEIKAPVQGYKNEWPTKKAMRIKIHRNNEEGEECIFQLGDSPQLRIRRNVEVIVPYDLKSILDDAVVDVPRCSMEPGQPISYYTEKVTRFEYSFFGELPWQDYLDFRAAQKKLKN